MARRPERLPHDAIVDDLAQAFRQSQAQILGQIRAAVQSGNLFKATERRLQLAAVVAALDQLGAVVDPMARQAVERAYDEGAGRAAAQIGAQIGRDPLASATFNGVRVEAIQQLQAAAVERLGASRRTVGRRVEDLYARAGRRAAVRALLGADGSPREAARSLAADITRDPEYRKLLKQGVTGFVDRTGRQWSLDTYSEMVVRTTTREAVVQGQVQKMADAGVNLCRISSHASSCAICRPFEGRLVSLDGKTTEFQGQSVADTSIGLPPYHPNCRHTVEPVVTEFEALRGGNGRAPTSAPQPSAPRAARTPTRRARSTSAQGSSQPSARQQVDAALSQARKNAANPAPPVPTKVPRFKTGKAGKQEATRWLMDNVLNVNQLGPLDREIFDTNLDDNGTLFGTAPADAAQSMVEGLVRVLGGTDLRLRIAHVASPGRSRALAIYTRDGIYGPGEIRMRRSWMQTKRKALQTVKLQSKWTAERIAQQIADQERRLGELERLGKKRSMPGVKRKLNELKAIKRHNVYEEADDPVRSVASHEAGHAVMRQTRGLEESWRREIASIPKVEWFKVSEYAASKRSGSELWAEVTAAVADGNANIVPAKILKAWRKVMKEFGYAA